MKRRGRAKKKPVSYQGTKKCVFCQPVTTEPLRSLPDVLATVRPFRSKQQEYFICLSLGAGQRLLHRHVVTIGLLNVSLVGVREVFSGPVADLATNVVLIHNHPSGIAAPSLEDIRTTKQLAAAGEILGIPVVDHIIITTGDRYFSFLEQGLIDDRKNR